MQQTDKCEQTMFLDLIQDHVDDNECSSSTDASTAKYTDTAHRDSGHRLNASKTISLGPTVFCRPRNWVKLQNLPFSAKFHGILQNFLKWLII